MREHHAVFFVVGWGGGFDDCWGPFSNLALAYPAGATAQPLAASPPYGWVVPLGGKTAFSFVGKRGVLSCSCFLLAQLGPQPSRWRLRRLTDGAYPLRVKPLFLLHHKRKAVLDSEKEKVDRWKSWRGAVQQDRGPILLGYPSGKRLWDILLFPAACV